MCDCFHVVLPTWPGAPGRGSSPGLQPGGPGRETQEDDSESEGPEEGTLRPRPQGSSPVYEWVTEGAGFGAQGEAPGGRRSSGRRRSWWKRHSDDSDASSMSHPQAVQETTEVTLKTEVEAGASGYSVTGGGAQGIFVQQVLKGSSAAKLFSLRAGDQLLSATIFFDDIKYEDALKILQYSEPYKVQFNLRRRLPAGDEEQGAVPQRGGARKEEQDAEAVDGYTKTLEADGDRERLLSTPRGGRGRRSQDRFSWPKFQAIKSQRVPGPRRSRSSSEAHERPGAQDASPGSTDTLRHSEPLERAAPGSRRKRCPLHLRLRRSSEGGPAGRGARGQGCAGVLEQREPGEDELQDTEMVASGRQESRTQMQEATPAQTTSLAMLGEEEPREEGRAARRARKTRDAADTQGVPGAHTALETSRQDKWDGMQNLRDSTEEVDARRQPGEAQVRIRHLNTPKFVFSEDKGPETQRGSFAHEEHKREQRSFGEGASGPRGPAGVGAASHCAAETEQEEGSGPGEPTRQGVEDMEGAEPDRSRGPQGMKMQTFKMPSFSWSPTKDGGTSYKKQIQEKEKQTGERKGEQHMTMKLDPIKDKDRNLKNGSKTQTEIIKKQKENTSLTEENDTINKDGMAVDIQAPGVRVDRALTLGDRAVHTKDSKFRKPKFKMPSFGVSPPSEPSEGVLDVMAANVQDDIGMSSDHGGLKTPEVSIQLPSAELESKAKQMAVKLPEGDLPGQPIGASLKGHLPKVQMPKVDLKGPEVDTKGPKLDVKGPTAEAGIPEVEVSLSTTEVGIPAPGANLEGDFTLGDRDVAAKESKFRMPKFKMPSFGVSAPRKSMEGSIEVSAPKVQVDVDLPSAHGEVKTPEVSIQLPSAELETKAGQMIVKLPEGDRPGQSIGARLKAQQPTVQMPSLKMPRVDLKGPQVDTKGPKLDVKGPTAEAGSPELEVSVSSVEVDIQTPDLVLKRDPAPRDMDVDTKDGKFKMTKFKMPSFGVSVPGRPSEASVEVSAPKMQGDVDLSSIHGGLKTPEVSIQLPSAELEAKAGQMAVKLPEGDLPGQPIGASLKGHLPKVQMPKVDLKGPEVDIKAHKLDVKGPTVEAGIPEVDVSLSTTEVDIPAPSANLGGDFTLGDRDVAAKDSKFRMPKFKMPSFAVSTPRKSLEGEIGVSIPKVQVDVDLPSAHGEVKTPEVSIQLPSAELEAKTGQMAVKLPEGDLPGQPKGASLKGHLPKVHMPSLKMPRVDLKGPEVDTKGPKLDVKGPTAGTGTSELEVSLLRTERDIQAPSANLEENLTPGDRDVAAKDSKFRMPKFKMPSFGVSTPRKSMEGSIEVSTPKVLEDMDLTSSHGELKTPEVSIQLPSAELEAKTGQVAVKLPEGDLPGQSIGASLKGHLPKVQMPSLKMPRVDLKGPQVQSKGPKLDVKGPTAMAGTPNVEVSLPIKQVDIQAHGAMLEGSLDQKDKDLETKDNKFRIPKFKMPTFEGAAPRKSMEGSIEVSTPKVLEDMDLTSSHGELKTPEVSIQLPSAELEAKTGQVAVKLPEGDLPGQSIGASLKGHLPKVQMPSLKMPRVDLKGPKLDAKGPKATEGVHDLDMALPSVELDIRAPIAQLEGDLAHEDQDVTTKDSKFKRPKLKVPSIGVTSESKSSEGSTEVTAHKGRAVDVPSIHGEMKTPEVSIQLSSAELEATAAQVAVKLVGVELPEEELPDKSTGARLKGHLPKVQMPSLKMPRVDLKDPKLDVKGPTAEAGSPELEESLPTTEVEIQAPSANVEGDLTLGDRDMATKDNKFRMPKFKMPSFAVSTPRKSLEGEIGVSIPKVQVDVDLPSAHGEVKTPEVSIQLPSAELETKTGQMAVKLPEGDLPGQPKGASLKGHLPKVHMPSLKMPRVDLKGPEVDTKGPKLDVKGPTAGTGTSELEVSLLRTERDIQAPSANLEENLTPGDRDVAAKDSKFRMPKFKMPSFGVSTPRKSMEGSIEVSTPKVLEDMDLTSSHGELKTPEVSIQLPSAELEAKTGQVAVKLPEGDLPGQSIGASLKGHLPKVQMPSLKMPRVDLKGPQVQSKGPKLDVKGPTAMAGTPNVEVSLPIKQVDIQAHGAMLEGSLDQKDKDLETKDNKFRIPKFKMPTFEGAAPRKSMEGSIEVSTPKVLEDMDLTSSHGELKTPEVSIQLPSAELEAKTGQVAVKLPEGDLPGQSIGASLKGHLPKVQMPSLKMPRVDLKGPKLDAKGPKATEGVHDLDVALPSVELDIRAPIAQLEGDLAHEDQDVTTKDSKFKRPKLKVPSIGVTSESKSSEGSTEVTAHKGRAMDVPSIHGEMKTPEVSIQLPSAELEATAAQVAVKLVGVELPEEELPDKSTGARLKGHLPKVQMPSLKMPRVDLKDPKLDVKGPTAEAGSPELEESLPTTEVEIQAPSANVEGDLTLGDRDMATKDNKFRMPKFKMPSFAVSTPRKSLEGEIGVSIPKVQVDVDLPSAHGEVKTPEVSIQLPSAELEAKTGQMAVKLPEGDLPGQSIGASLKGHLPKVHMPSLKMPRVDLKGPEVDTKGPKLDVKGPTAGTGTSELEVSLLRTERNIQAPSANLEGDLTPGDRDVAAKDSKFRMPKFKMPSFGVSTPRKSLEVEIGVSLPKVQGDMDLPSAHGELTTPEGSGQLPSADLETKAGQVAMKLPEGQLPEGEPTIQPGVSLKGQLPTVQMPSLKMPRVDLQGPQVDIKIPKLDFKGPRREAGTPEVELSLPSVELDMQTTDVKPEDDQSQRDDDLDTKDGKFRMPKVKMPSLGATAASKPGEGEMELSVPKVQGDVALPSIDSDLKTPEVSAQLPSADLEAKARQVAVKLPKGDLPGQPKGASLKGHLPKVHMPSLKMPRVDLKDPKLDVKGPTAEAGSPELEVSLPTTEVEIQAPSANLEGDLTLGDRDVATKDNKFRMPKFKMPSFAVSTPRKSLEGEIGVSVPKVQVDVDLPSAHGEVKTPEVSIQLPSAELEAKTGQVAVKLPEGDLPGQPKGASLKGHLAKVHMPSLKMPRVDLKGPEVDTKGPKLDVKGPTAMAGTPNVEVSLPIKQVDIQAHGAMLEGSLDQKDKDLETKDSKFRIPKFKMPTFEGAAPRKSMEGSIEVSTPKVLEDMDLTSSHGELKTPEVSIQLPSAELEAKTGQVAVKLPEGDLPGQSIGASLKGHLPKVQMPSLKMPRVDLKGPKLDAKGPKATEGVHDLDVALPSVELDIRAPIAQLEGDLAHEDQDVTTKDSKFKRPKLKVPSIGVTSESKSSEGSTEVTAHKGRAMDVPSIHGEMKTPEVSIQLPSAELEATAAQVAVKLVGVELPEEELPDKSTGARLKGHLPKVQMPSLKMPRVDLKDPKLDMKGPTAEVGSPELGVSLPTTEVEIQAPSANLEGDLTLGDRDMATKDNKFRMPKFKMPSFAVSTPRKSLEGEIGVSVPKVQVDVDLPSAHVEVKTPEVSIQLPSAELEAKTGQMAVKLPEGDLPGQSIGASLKGHLPKVHMPSLKMPRVDLKDPKLDVKGPTAMAGTPEIEVSLPIKGVDIQAPGVKLQGALDQKDKDLDTKDSKFRMPKFKMPSFGVSAPRKSMEGSIEVSAPKVQVDVDLPSAHGEVKTPEVSIQLPSAELESKAKQMAVKLPEGDLPGQPIGASLKGHLPKVQMPKVDLKGPEVDTKGPKLDVKGPTAEAGIPEVEVSLSTTEVGIPAPGANLEGDFTLGDRDVAAKESKFRMPKFKMPSFGVSAPRKSMEGSIEVSAPKVQVDVDLPSAHGEVKTPEVSIQLPSAELETKAGQMIVKLPEGDRPGQSIGARLKAQQPTVQMPSLKMPRVDLKGPQVDTKGPKLDVKGPTAEAGSPELEVSVSSVEVDIQTPDLVLKRDPAPRDMDVDTKDGKFKMTKFKMPSFGVSVPGRPSEASVEVSAPKMQGDVDLSSIHGGLKTPEVSIQLPSAELEAKAGQMAVKLPEGDLPGQPIGASLKGHLPKVQMPKVDLQGPEVDTKGPKLDVKGPTAESGTPELEVSLPTTEVDILAPSANLEGDLTLGDRDMATKDSKFRMPKFKMPSFGVSTPRKSLEGEIGVSVPKVQADMDLPSAHGELTTPEGSGQLPSADLETKAGQVAMKLPEGQLPEGEPTIQPGVSLKGQLPTVQMPSLKMPRVDLQGPQVDIKGPKVEGDTPELEVSLPITDIQVPGPKVEGALAQRDKDLDTKASKFRMPKFKMPSFGVSTSRKSTEGSTEVSAPKVQDDVALPSAHSEVKTPEVSIQVPSAELEAKASQVAMQLPKAQLPGGQLSDQSFGASLEGQLPTVQVSRLTMPKVDLQGPQEDTKGSKLAVKGPKATEGVHDLDVALPSVEQAIRAPIAQPEGDLAHGDQDVTTKDSKFKRPKVEMPSSGASGSGPALECALVGWTPQGQGHACVPSVQGGLKTPEVSRQPPPAELEAQAHQLSVSRSEEHFTDRFVPPSHFPISFPKFHEPRFIVCSPDVTLCDIAAVPVMEPTSDIPLASGQHPCSALSVSTHADGSSGVPACDIPVCDIPVERVKSSPRKLPQFKLPSFSLSSKKGLESPGSHESSADAPTMTLPPKSDQAVSQPCAQVSHAEASSDISSDKDGEKGRAKKPGLAFRRLSLPKLRVSKGQASLPQGGAGTALSRGLAAGDPESSEKGTAEDVALGAGMKEGLSEGFGVNLQVAELCTPSLGFAKPGLRASTAKMEMKPWKADLPLPDSKGPEPEDISASRSHGEGTVLTPEDPLQFSCRQPEAAPAMGPEEGAGGEAPADEPERWLTTPKFPLPGFGRSASQGQEDTPAAAPEVAAAAGSQTPQVPQPKVGTEVSPAPPEWGLAVTALSRSACTHVQRADSPSTDLELSTSEATAPSTEGLLPAQPPGGGRSEREGGRGPLPGPGGLGLASGEQVSPQPAGPLKLRVSQTHVPAQISVVRVEQLWEESVLTARVPTSSGPTPGREAEFSPRVRDAEAEACAVGGQGRPGLRGARPVRAYTRDTGEGPADPSSEAPPISKVKVHILGAQGESQEAVACRREPTQERPRAATDAETFSTPIVTQIPSYGFSLVKVKAQAGMYTGALEGLAEALMPAVPGGPQPEVAEPCEMGSVSAHLPGPHALSPGEPPSLRLAHSGSDEEPTAILECPQDSQEVSAPPAGEDRALKEKPGSKKSSGVLWSWLPSVGFPSFGERSAEPGEDVGSPTPIQTQPGARAEADLPRKHEKPGWFHLPKLGFSSPTQKSSQDRQREAQRRQEETATFFDARESFSPEGEEEEGGERAASAEQDGNAPGPWAE